MEATKLLHLIVERWNEEQLRMMLDDDFILFEEEYQKVFRGRGGNHLPEKSLARKEMMDRNYVICSSFRKAYCQGSQHFKLVRTVG